MGLDLTGNKLYSTSVGPKGEVIKQLSTDGLVLHLDAGNKNSYSGSGTTWTDLSGNANTGTLTNGPTFNSTFGGNIVFDSIDDFVSVGNIGSFSTFTVEIWFKSDSVSNYRNPIDCNWLVFNGGASGYSNIGPRLEQNSSGTLGWVVGDSSGGYTGIDVVSSGLNSTLRHCAVITKTGTSSFLSYYNGTNVSSLTFSGWIGTMSNVNIGKGFSASSERWFSGNVPVVRIYNRALSSSEIKQNYNIQKSRFGL
jgi:hypothetical protein